MKPKYIFSAVFVVSILLSIVLPGIGSNRIKTVDAYAAPVANTVFQTDVSLTAPTLPPIILNDDSAPNTQPTLAPISAGAPLADAPVQAAVQEAVQAAAPSPTSPAPPLEAAFDAIADIAGSNNAAPIQASATLPELEAFAASFTGIPADEVAGAFVPGLFALPVIPQPDNEPNFVSPDDNILTQFIRPGRFNVIGLLAHNYLAGKPFFQLTMGQEIFVVYGGGRIERFRVTGFQHYQAVNSQFTDTDFINLDDPQNSVLTNTQVFDRVYTNSGQLVLQTCIEKDGDLSWGRLFVIATRE